MIPSAALLPCSPEHPRPRRIWALVILLLSTAFTCHVVGVPTPSGEQPELQAEEHAVKAALLFNFGRFVTWPDIAFADSRAPFRIGVVEGGPGSQRLIEALRAIAHEKLLTGRSVEISKVSRDSDLADFQIVFFPRRAATSPSKLPVGPTVLTVGEGTDFLADGGMILMTLVEGRVALEIHELRAREAGLRISSSLLDIAQRVISQPKEEAS